MKEYLRKLVKNNGVARGWLYVVNTAATMLAVDLLAFGSWLYTHHGSLRDYQIDWLVDPLLILAFVVGKLLSVAAGVTNTIRAYLDQHLSKTSKNEDNSTDTTVTTKP